MLVPTEKRLGFRVAMEELPEHLQRQMSTVIVHDGRESAATVIDLSLSGMLVTDLEFGLSAGDRVAATIEFGGISTTLDGTIVRTVGNGRVALRFPGSVRDGVFDPPVRLSRIHRALEQAWLQARKPKNKR
ncbi:MAG: PilZ domain-containing protein [Pseudomonadales bacterium]